MSQLCRILNSNYSKLAAIRFLFELLAQSIFHVNGTRVADVF